MAAGKHGASEVTVTVDDGPGGAPQVITQYVRGDIRLKILAMLQASHGFGDSWDESTPTGHAKAEDIVLRGYYDDTATSGPHVVLAVQSGDRDPQGATRTLVLGWGNSKTSTVECRLVSYERLGKIENLTEYEAVLRPSGAVAEA
jgi:hypothetical protein